MEEISVELHTGSHCIESAAKNEFRKITGMLLENDDESSSQFLEQQLELLREFITESDFNFLRRSDRVLSGEIPGVCVIKRNMSGLAEIKYIRIKK